MRELKNRIARHARIVGRGIPAILLLCVVAWGPLAAALPARAAEVACESGRSCPAGYQCLESGGCAKEAPPGVCPAGTRAAPSGACYSSDWSTCGYGGGCMPGMYCSNPAAGTCTTIGRNVDTFTGGTGCPRGAVAFSGGCWRASDRNACRSGSSCGRGSLCAEGRRCVVPTGAIRPQIAAGEGRLQEGRPPGGAPGPRETVARGGQDPGSADPSCYDIGPGEEDSWRRGATIIVVDNTRCPGPIAVRVCIEQAGGRPNCGIVRAGKGRSGMHYAYRSTGRYTHTLAR